ncbi:hypothetical protein AaE_004673 [Aphanomyces astaci]|uniref:Protein kinase domain-containing protein n=1 Tax=Aphanomyces astaci TaxID=112090 RepID=A0A6A5A9Y8_APHAT|nr:hypothetical protein AaE_004673 [Aphanomyces astaci]
MNRYEILDRLGDGAYGEVLKARNLKTNEVVAIKKLKMLFPTWEECLQLRELKSLKVLRHDNIIQLKEVIRDKAELYFVFEYMDTSLFAWMRKNNAKEPQIRTIMSQLFSGLAYMHKHGFFHRDIKPENCLCSSGIEVLKVADLGQAREIRSRPPFTDYVSTRWYRSPELLLRSTTYNSPIDLWACGCIMAELFLGKPLFAGSSEADQMCRICGILGTPTKESWPEGVTMVSQMQFKFPKCNPVPLKMAIPNASPAAIQLMVDLLHCAGTAVSLLHARHSAVWGAGCQANCTPDDGQRRQKGLHLGSRTAQEAVCDNPLVGLGQRLQRQSEPTTGGIWMCPNPKTAA